MESRAVIQALTLALPILAFAAAGCSDDDPTGPAGDPNRCVTEVAGNGFVELCTPTAGAIRHVRIEHLQAPATHASTAVVFGAGTAPTSPTAPVGTGEFRVLFYGGGFPAPAALVQVTFGSVDATLDGDGTFINDGATVCFDLHDGGAAAAPAFILWVTGVRGADCANVSTLTASTAYGARSFWNGVTGVINKSAGTFIRQSSGSTPPTVTASTAAALDESAIAAATTCTTTWATNTDWQPFCTPAAGLARHVRLENVYSTANNSYFYAVIGQEANPTGNPTPTAGKLIVTGGRSNSGTSWTWFRFDNGTTTQYSYATDASAALYTAGPSTICFDIGANDEGNARLVVWATGANSANCSDRTTLTLARALYDSEADAAAGSIWDVPYVSGLLNFVKTSNPNVSIGNVVVVSEPAALP